MNLKHFAGAAYRVLAAGRAGPTLYDLCDPLLRGAGPGDPHLRKFYKTALANPALRPLLSRAGLGQLHDPARFGALHDALLSARDQASPDWEAVGRPIAALIDQFPQAHPRPTSAPGMRHAPPLEAIEKIISACARHLIGCFARNGFIPGLCGLQPRRRSGSPRPRPDRGVARAQCPHLQERDAAVQPRPRLHPGQSARRRRSSIRPGAGLPSRCGSRSRSAIAPPITTPSSPRR